MLLDSFERDKLAHQSLSTIRISLPALSLPKGPSGRKARTRAGRSCDPSRRSLSADLCSAASAKEQGGPWSAAARRRSHFGRRPNPLRGNPFVKDKSKDNIPPILQEGRFCRGHVADDSVLDRVFRSSIEPLTVSSWFARVSSWLDLGSYRCACPRPVGHPFVGAGVPGSGPTHEIVKPEVLPGAQSKRGPRRTTARRNHRSAGALPAVGPGNTRDEHKRMTATANGNSRKPAAVDAHAPSGTVTCSSSYS